MDPPILTTMVVLYTTEVRLETDILVRDLPLTNGLIKIEKQGVLRRGESKRDRIRHRTPAVAVPRRSTGFGHNSITLVLLSSGTSGTKPEKEITVKIFQNGVFHITGVLDEEYDRDVVTRLHAHITEHCAAAVLSGTWNLESRRVVLMNYKTKLVGVTNLSRETLYATVRQKGFKTNYEPAVYPAVKIYFPDTRWIAKVFRTGNIILTGMTTAEECERLMTSLREVLA
jgi:TATA-box binding protein (TBP) (component of TFIID and TFIIIB)